MTADMTKETDMSFLPSRSLVMPVIRRSRSLSELPGSIRVPILRRTDSDRMRARLEASMQGLEELKLLKEQQKKIIDDAMTSSFQRSGRSNIQQNLQRRMSVSSLRSSSTSLAKISEEVSEGDSGGCVFVNNRSSSSGPGWASQRRHSFAQAQHSRSRRPLSLADSDILEQELFDETDRLKKHHSWTSLMHNFYGSQPQALESTRSTECLRKSRSDDILVNIPTGKLGRSQSFSVASENSKILFPFSREKSHNSENIEPKLRRASIQCEAVLSGVVSADSKQRGLFKDVDLNGLRGNVPNPLRAVLKQYENNQSLRESQRKNSFSERESDSQPIAKPSCSPKSEYSPVFDNCKKTYGIHGDNKQVQKEDKARNNFDEREGNSKSSTNVLYSKSESNRVCDNYNQTNGIRGNDMQIRNNNHSSNSEIAYARNAYSLRESTENVSFSSRESMSAKNITAGGNISDHGDNNINNIGRRFSMSTAITSCDAINNNTCFKNYVSTDSINNLETRTTRSVDNISNVMTPVVSEAETGSDTSGVAPTKASGEPEHSRRNNNYQVCSTVMNNYCQTSNRGQDCLNANFVCPTNNKSMNSNSPVINGSIPIESPTLPSLAVSVMSKRKREDNTYLDISACSDVGSSSTDHNISLASSNDNTSYNKKMLSIASDEGYVTSPPSSPRGHNRHENSILSNGSWISTDLDETTGIHSTCVGIYKNTETVVSDGNKNIVSMSKTSVHSTPNVTSSTLDPEKVADEHKSDLSATGDVHDVSNSRPFRQTAV